MIIHYVCVLLKAVYWFLKSCKYIIIGLNVLIINLANAINYSEAVSL